MSEPRCIHDLPPEQCVDCKPPPVGLPRQVVTTAGGSVFHRSSDCRALQEGQAYAARLGQVVHPPRRESPHAARSRGREACAVCLSV